MTNLKPISELKAFVREQALDKYGTLIGADILYAVIIFFVSAIATFTANGVVQLIINELIVLIINILIGIFVSGKTYLYMNLVYSQTVSISDLFFGFKKNPEKAVIIQAFFVIIDFVVGLPASYLVYLLRQSSSPSSDLIMLGLIAVLVELVVNIYIRITYSQAFYLLHDFPDRSAKELLLTSRRIMNGHRLRLLVLNLTFVPLFLLGILTLGIPLLWINVYRNGTLAAFYQDLIMQKAKKSE